MLEYQDGQIIKIRSTAVVFTEVRLIDTIPAKDAGFVLASATPPPYSVTAAGEDTVVEWRFDSVVTGQDRTISFDLDLYNLVPGEERIVDRSLELIYKDMNNEEIRVLLPSLSVPVLASSFTSLLSTDRPGYGADENVAITAKITTNGSYYGENHHQRRRYSKSSCPDIHRGQCGEPRRPGRGIYHERPRNLFLARLDVQNSGNNNGDQAV